MTDPGPLLVFVRWAVIGCSVYLAIELALFVMWWTVAIRERWARKRDSAIEDYDLLQSSRFTIPVSVIVPAFNEAVAIVPVVRALLAFRYPEFEVIVVNDGSTDDTLARLEAAFGLERRAAFSREVVPTTEVRAVYRSAVDPRLIVVDKANGGKADALNVGMSVARYRYLCCVDGDTYYEPDALLHAMRLAMQDAGRVVAVTSHLAPTSYPETMADAGRGERRIDRRWLVGFQQLEYVRSFLLTRLAWSRGNYVMVTPGAFMIYRRDVVEELGGFSPRFTCEDIELTFRAHERYRRQGRSYRILSLPHTIGYTEAPAQLSFLISQRARWQRVIMETTWHYRRMLGNPRYGRVGLVGMPYYLFYECLSPIVEAVGLALVPVAWLLGVFDAMTFVTLAASMAVFNAVLTSAAIVHDDAFVRYSLRDLVRVLALAALEVFLYRPVLLYARCRGIWEFCRGDKSWQRFARNARPVTSGLGVSSEVRV